jgi:hypothetical protein
MGKGPEKPKINSWKFIASREKENVRDANKINL